MLSDATRARRHGHPILRPRNRLDRSCATHLLGSLGRGRSALRRCWLLVDRRYPRTHRRDQHARVRDVQAAGGGLHADVRQPHARRRSVELPTQRTGPDADVVAQGERPIQRRTNPATTLPMVSN